MKYYSDVDVNLIDHMGDDDSVIRAAQVSVVGENEPDMTEKRRTGLINYLAKNRHGSPFEHTAMTFYVHAPIMVFREFQRHRIASYNEISGRYAELPGTFYLPNEDRPLVNAGSGAHPNLVAGEPELHSFVVDEMVLAYDLAWNTYQNLLNAGVANELARSVLPVGLYSQMYVTMNIRALMNFLSLRVNEPDAAYPSKPQYEIDMVARKMESFFAEKFPLVHSAFVANGRVAP